MNTPNLAELKQYLQDVRPCRYCAQPITYNLHMLNSRGRPVAVNPDLSLHRCLNKATEPFDEEAAISAAIEFIAGVNARLSTATLVIRREAKSC